MQLAASDRKILLVAGGAFVVLVLLAALLAGPASPELEIATTYSTASSGAKAAYLLLKESGYKIDRWEQAPNELPRESKGMVLILADPSVLTNPSDRAGLEKFLAGGGRIVATGAWGSFLLPESGALTPSVEPSTWDRAYASAPSPLTRAAPVIFLLHQAYWRTNSSALTLYRVGGDAVVVHYPHGAGDVIWLASATPFTNAGLKEPGNLEFLLAVVGDRQASSILWDEYFHGFRRSLAASMAHSEVRWFFLQLALIALAVLLTFSRRSGPVRDPAPESRLSPIEFVETLGGLYNRANAAAVAVDVYYQRFRYWMTRRLGMAADTSVAELERAAADRWNFHDGRFAETLRACESARYQPEMSGAQALALIQQLYSFALEMHLFPASQQENK